jgi:hypothetical protein
VRIYATHLGLRRPLVEKEYVGLLGLILAISRQLEVLRGDEDSDEQDAVPV